MKKLQKSVQKKEEEKLHLNSKNFLRPPLKQIDASITEIKHHFEQKGSVTKVPSRLADVWRNIGDEVHSLLKKDGFLFHKSILNGFTTCGELTAFVHLSESLALTLDFPVLPRENEVKCDLLLITPHQPIMVLTLLDCDNKTRIAINYNTAVAREVTTKLRRFTNENVNVVHGVLCKTGLINNDMWYIKLRELAALSASLVPESSLMMTPSKYEHVMVAFWAAVAETKSVLTETGEVDDSCIYFLTKDQCVYLVENIDSKYVQLRYGPGTGATTLMLEVARRLSRLGDTLLVCSSHEERDRLRSVYPSTISLDDLSEWDISVFEHVVHKTNSLPFKLSGRQWSFQEDPQQMSKDSATPSALKPSMNEEGFYYDSKDFLRPRFKQTETMIDDIKRHYILKGDVNIVPTKLPTNLIDIKDKLFSMLETNGPLYSQALVNGEAVDANCDTTCFVHLSESLAVSLDFPVLQRPGQIMCDIFLAMPQQPLMVLTVVRRFSDTIEDIRIYNTSVARGVTANLRRFTHDGINVVHGIIWTSDLKDQGVFFAKLQKMAKRCSSFVPYSSLVMNASKYEHVMMAFWAAVAETMTGCDGEDANYLTFLKKEQCIVLLENMNSNNVEVICECDEDARTLMLAVARRLNRLGDTLLMCRSKEVRARLRSEHNSTMSIHDVWCADLSRFENIVYDAHVLPFEPRGRRWLFKTVSGSAKEMKVRLETAEKEVHEMERQITSLRNDEWKGQMEYIFGEADVLKLFPLLYTFYTTNFLMTSLNGGSSTKESMLPHEPPNQPLGGDEQTEKELQKRMKLKKELFHFLRMAAIDVRTKLLFLQETATHSRTGATLEMFTTDDTPEHQVKGQTKPKSVFRKVIGSIKKKVSRKRKGGKTQEQNVLQDVPLLSEGNSEDGRDPQKTAMEGPQSSSEGVTTEQGEENTEMKGQGSVDNVTQDKTDVYLPPDSVQYKNGLILADVKDVSSHISETSPGERLHLQNTTTNDPRDTGDEEKLKEDLENIEKERDAKLLQLVSLYTVEWQNILSYLDTNLSISPFAEHQESICTVADTMKSTSHTNLPLQRGLGSSHPRFQKQSLVHDLRQFQQGRLTERRLFTMFGHMISGVKKNMISLQTKVCGSPVHIVGGVVSPGSYLVSCNTLQLDTDRANISMCHVTKDGELVNSPPATRNQRQSSFQSYSGTCSSTPIPLLSSNLTPVHPTSQYWETKSRVGVMSDAGQPILELGVVEAGQLDRAGWVCYQRRSWCIGVWSCHKHRGVCTSVDQEAEPGKCWTNTMSNTPGTQASLHHGAVLDVGRGRLAFIDLDREVVLARMNVEFREPLYLTFAVGPWPDRYTVKTTLISGEDIVMTDTKKSLIANALT
ncbi:uncharacterized protein LOC124130348 isoform X2 [Haliotis rufescens]|uniref:uncharacterized protein LOC124130348 isoform X2 n=1 Tax=Haliotis rufescens TaxID=6454 RepID=UPI00201F1C27|nr:uncharacterized protein LOC124130348 isoform X2 [Haliotis rufescens]